MVAEEMIEEDRKIVGGPFVLRSDVMRALMSIGLPLETLAALRAGTWKVVPAVPTEEMLGELDVLADGRFSDDVLADVWASTLAAAPAKPGVGK